MISLQGITKYYPSKLGNQVVFDDLWFDIPDDHNIGLLGANGAGKSTLFRILAGSEYANKGSIKTDLNLSWPVALATGIHPLMTGRENTRFIGRVNGISDLNDFERKVQEFSELGNRYDLPVQTYSSGMRARLAFACCISIEFDVYLIDEALSVGDAKFKKKAREAMIDKSKVANLIMVSHDLEEIRFFCDSAIVIADGRLEFFNDLEHAISVYKGGAK
ncbi:ABC transporter ATP-binding protein [Neiella sp. HB171785]|uniref:ABC transporter ATP-binding protein n=1 Tax=Neiella litorisoli TaxID=2771431 RepID=A0A8J6UER1_9GAMM|nr:ABC transporter ATP-binding protein [Neiella litorisoli]MBD1389819.1 ABC transporter ATP-binding protein [Neiella litorisoli]